MTFRGTLAYFWAVQSRRRYFIVAFAVVVVMGLIIELVNQGASDFSAVMILIIQTFAVSTGFTAHASRGFYDPVLIQGRSRVTAASTHFLAAAGPGVLAWFFVGVIEALRAGSVHVIAFRASTVVALFLVSSVAWAVSLRLPPYAGGGVWIIIGISFFVSGRFLSWLAPLTRDPQWALDNPGHALFVGLLFPILMPGSSFPPTSLAALGAIATLAIVGGIFFIRRHDFPLAEEG